MNWIDIEEVKYIINFMKDCYDLSLINGCVQDKY
jgi:hypothetical protein